MDIKNVKYLDTESQQKCKHDFVTETYWKGETGDVVCTKCGYSMDKKEYRKSLER